MKILIQIVNRAKVVVDNTIVNQINKGYLLFVGIEVGDDENVVEKMANKIVNMRINKDENDKTNLSILQTNGEILSISQFTLCAKLDSRRPSFTNAEKPEVSQKLYELFNLTLNNLGVKTYDGVFGADMKVELENDGPFTIYVDSKMYK